MSSALAIAAATSTLQQLLATGIPGRDPDLPGLTVTTLPLDTARPANGDGGLQLNLFLYQTVLNAAWRNQDMPRQVRPGETAPPPLALDLFYLITPYGNTDDGRGDLSQRILGAAMGVLHDHAVLSPAEILSSRIRDNSGDSDLDRQVERIRITSQPLSIDEISKLWTAFQANYRLSAAYEVSVVLIESLRPARAPLPVLTRGKDDTGVQSRANLLTPYPHLDAVELPGREAAARPGDTIALSGSNLSGTGPKIRLTTARLPQPIEVDPLPGGTDSRVAVTVPDTPAEWPAGISTLAVVVQRPDETYRRETNEVPVALAPDIGAIAPNPAARDANGAVTLTVDVSPQVLPGQRATLLVGDREIRAAPLAAAAAQLTFVVAEAQPGEFYLRLRVDGVDSPVVLPASTPPSFDPAVKVTVT